MKKKIKKVIPDCLYGIPKERKYPLDTPDHILLVINFFNKVPKKYKEELAINIYKAANKLTQKEKIYLNKTSYDELNKYISHYKELNRINCINKKEIDTFLYTSENNIKYYDLDFNQINNNFFISDDKNILIEKIRKEIKNKKKLSTNRCEKFLIYGYNSNIDDPFIFYLGDIHAKVPINSKEILFQTDIQIFEEINTFKIDKEIFLDSILDEEINNENIKIDKLNKKDNKKYYNRIQKFDNYKSLYIKMSSEEKELLSNRENYLSKYINNNSYIVSDLHFGMMDKSYDNEIINKINSLVSKSDTLIFLGDIGYKYKLNVDYLTKCIKSINCENKFLILGNHDILSIEEYLDMGFINIFESFIYKNIILSHYPRNQKEGFINIHGDIHSSFYYPNYIKSEKNKFNCFWNEVKCPLTIKEILKLINNEYN